MNRQVSPPSRLARARSAAQQLSPEAERLAKQVRTDRAAKPAQNQEGASASFLTGPWAALGVLIIGTLVASQLNLGFFSGGGAATQEVQHSQCQVIQTQPVADAQERTLVRSGLLDDSQPNRYNAIISFRQCQPDSCPGDDRVRYVNTLSDYLGHRLKAADYAYRNFGRKGLDHALGVHKTKTDFNIVYGAKERMAAGVLEPAFLSPEKLSFLQLLIAHGTDELPVCFRPAAKR